jgi:hypothetical protein
MYLFATDQVVCVLPFFKGGWLLNTLIKNENQICLISYIRKFRKAQLQSHI